MDEWARAQIEALELRVAHLERALGGDAPAPSRAAEPAADGELIRFLREGKEIHAIKHYCDTRGVSLAESKAVVARLKAQLGL